MNKRLTAILGIKGVFVLQVSTSSSAAKAGLIGAKLSADGTVVPGDVITAVDGKEVASVSELLRSIDDKKIGEQVRLTVLRGGQNLTLNLELEPGI